MSKGVASIAIEIVRRKCDQVGFAVQSSAFPQGFAFAVLRPLANYIVPTFVSGLEVSRQVHLVHPDWQPIAGHQRVGSHRPWIIQPFIGRLR